MYKSRGHLKSHLGFGPNQILRIYGKISGVKSKFSLQMYIEMFLKDD